MAGVSTFEIFKTLLTNSVNADASLSSSTKASMVIRIADLARSYPLILNYENQDSVAGNVSVSEALKSILIASGAPGTPNRVEFDLVNFSVPVRIDGTQGAIGALIGHGGTSLDPLVDTADITLQYRLTASGTWKAFNQTTLLDNVTSVQFAAAIADQGSAASLPELHIVAQQV